MRPLTAAMLAYAAQGAAVKRTAIEMLKQITIDDAIIKGFLSTI